MAGPVNDLTFLHTLADTTVSIRFLGIQQCRIQDVLFSRTRHLLELAPANLLVAEGPARKTRDPRKSDKQKASTVGL